MDMELSTFFAKIFGLLYLFIGLGALLDPKYFYDIFKDITKDQKQSFWAGSVALVTGLILVTYHNIWVKEWVVIITLFGWAGLVKAFLLLVTPRWIMGWGHKFYKNKNNFNIVKVGILVLGLALSYFGFLA